MNTQRTSGCTLRAASGATVTRDVGSEYMATARPMDPPPLKNKGHEPRGNDLGERSQEQPMKKDPTRRSTITRHKWREGER